MIYLKLIFKKINNLKTRLKKKLNKLKRIKKIVLKDLVFLFFERE